MTLSDVIAWLQEELKEHGDVQFYVLNRQADITTCDELMPWYIRYRTSGEPQPGCEDDFFPERVVIE